MKRRALLISYPGEDGQPDYCPGVNEDIKHYRNFLTSPNGGSWLPDELEHLPCPALSQVRNSVGKLQYYDYSLVAFSGHGWYSTIENSTILCLRKGVQMDHVELRHGAPRHTLILDSCRLRHAFPLIEEQMMKFAADAVHLDPGRCREVFDQAIQASPKTTIVAFSCDSETDTGETAADTPQGGAYTASLLTIARNWAKQTRQVAALSVIEAHDAAARHVTARWDQQHPQIEKPRSGPYFPFAVVA